MVNECGQKKFLLTYVHDITVCRKEQKKTNKEDNGIITTREKYDPEVSL